MKHYFLGSNTPDGFIGYYNIVNSGGSRLFILKGGSGVGKHTFMKKVAAEMEKSKTEVEYCHCSNDVNSLDGIMIPSIGVGIIDGTSPHIVDPQLPACFDEIIDLGKYIDVSSVVNKRNLIAELSAQKKQMYKRSYTYLKNAKLLHDDTAKLISSCVNNDKFNEILQALPKSLIKNNHSTGKIKHIFASAYTSSGYVDYINTLIKEKHTVGIKNYYCLNKAVMQSIYEYGVLCKKSMTLCHSILDSKQIDHILLDDINILSIDEHNKFNDVDEVINLKDIVNKDMLMDINNDITWNNQHFDKFVEKAISIMSSCGKTHKQLEEIYIPAMDFDGVNTELNKVLEKIRGYII